MVIAQDSPKILNKCCTLGQVLFFMVKGTDVRRFREETLLGMVRSSSSNLQRQRVQTSVLGEQKC